MIRQTSRWRDAWRHDSEPGVHVLNDIVLNQVLVRFAGGSARSTDQATVDVIARVQADGTCWVGGATWFGEQVMRISISNWSTTEDDIDRSADVILVSYRVGRGI